MNNIIAQNKNLYAFNWIRTSDVFSERDYESRAIVHSAINADYNTKIIFFNLDVVYAYDYYT